MTIFDVRLSTTQSPLWSLRMGRRGLQAGGRGEGGGGGGGGGGSAEGVSKNDCYLPKAREPVVVSSIAIPLLVM